MSTTFNSGFNGTDVPASTTDASAVDQVKEGVADFGRDASRKLDESRETAACGLQKAATAIHDTADNLPGSKEIVNFAHSAADKLAMTADYVKHNDVTAMMYDVENLVRRNPGTSLIVAGATGFLLARALRNND